MTPASYRRVTLGSVIVLGAIVVSGAAVRLTGSGLGCTDWPTCENNELVGDFGYHGWIEYGNRLVTGLVSVAVILAVLGSLRRRPRRRDLVAWSLGLVAGMIGQIVLGAVVVYLHLDPRYVIGHFLLSMVLVWNAIVLHWRAGLPDGRNGTPQAPADAVTPSPSLRWHTWALSAVASVVLVTGTIVTGSGPHTGSLDEPVERLSFSIPDVARVHSLTVWVLVATAVALRWRLRPESGDPVGPAPARAAVRRHADITIGIMLAQGAIGYAQYFTDVPVLLVGIHIGGAVALWSAVVSLHLRLLGPAAFAARPTTDPAELVPT